MILSNPDRFNGSPVEPPVQSGLIRFDAEPVLKLDRTGHQTAEVSHSRLPTYRYGISKDNKTQLVWSIGPVQPVLLDQLVRNRRKFSASYTHNPTAQSYLSAYPPNGKLFCAVTRPFGGESGCVKSPSTQKKSDVAS
ncbi:hypothetical protein KFK09_003585 [Dendrobium nobile]|uniref:Uncharacterized protein n=1 Tax=Dendrobium nobile TaxID=94219 RepID=A0A8T3C3K5_DENNO|nr:hypothetical protein KFK09_003585 [Dendrobium nobile]